jgi:hypothetical protein
VIGGAYTVAKDAQDRQLPTPTVVVEGRSTPDATGQQLYQKKKLQLYLIILILLIVVIVVIVVVVVLKQTGKAESGGSASSLGNDDEGDTFSLLSPSLQPSWAPSGMPSTSYPSSVPSTGAPTSSAFDSVVQALNLTDIPSSPESPVFRAIKWMAVFDTLPPTLQRFALVVFYYATGGEGWLDQHGFLNPNTHECLDWKALDSKGPSIGAFCVADSLNVRALQFRKYTVHVCMLRDRGSISHSPLSLPFRSKHWPPPIHLFSFE